MGKEIGKYAQTKTSPRGHHPCRFSIFYCGCKQPKSIHILFSVAKLAQKKYRAKQKRHFFVLFVVVHCKLLYLCT